MIDPETKSFIDAMSYEEMLRRLRFSPIGDPFFVFDDVTQYFFEVMRKKELSVNKAAISKKVGWL